MVQIIYINLNGSTAEVMVNRFNEIWILTYSLPYVICQTIVRQHGSNELVVSQLEDVIREGEHAIKRVMGL